MVQRTAIIRKKKADIQYIDRPRPHTTSHPRRAKSRHLGKNWVDPERFTRGARLSCSRARRYFITTPWTLADSSATLGGICADRVDCSKSLLPLSTLALSPTALVTIATAVFTEPSTHRPGHHSLTGGALRRKGLEFRPPRLHLCTQVEARSLSSSNTSNSTAPRT